MRRRNVHLVPPPRHHRRSDFVEIFRLGAIVEFSQKLPLYFFQWWHVLRHGELTKVNACTNVRSKSSLDSGRLHLDDDGSAAVLFRQLCPVRLSDTRHSERSFVPRLEHVRVSIFLQFSYCDRPRLARFHLHGCAILRVLAPRQVLPRHKVVPRRQQLRVFQIKSPHRVH